MPDTVLAGPDGQPAIDQATGQPLTIEELLRRRGLLAVNGATRVNGQAPATPVQASTAQAPNPLEQAMAARQQNKVVATAGGSGEPNSTATATPTTVDPNTVASDPNSNAPNGASGIDPTTLLGGVAAVGGAGGLAYALNKRRKAKGTGPAGMSGADTGPTPKPGQAGGGGAVVKTAKTMPGTGANRNNSLTQVHGELPNNVPIPEGEYTEVNPLLKVLTDKRVLKALQRIK